MKSWRHLIMLGLFLVLMSSLIGRLVFLNLSQASFLKREGELSSVRIEEMPGLRGIIYDRNGEPLAVSTPVWSLWVDPSRLTLQARDVRKLATILGLARNRLMEQIESASVKRFLYLKRRLTPNQYALLQATGIPGLRYQREYRRYYPAAETTAHVVGLAGMDDRGREGSELAFDDYLSGQSGRKRVLRDRRNHTVKDLEFLEAPKMGRDLWLSLDLRLQYFAYRELLAAVGQSSAKSGSMVMLDARSGEVLAMVNYPSFNPNALDHLDFASMRNRAITDTYEPGSTVKPLTVVAALESGLFNSNSRIDTSPGYLRVGSKLVQDPLNRGVISLSTVLQKSSQVGIAKIALTLPASSIYEVFSRAGFGQPTQLGLPGEASGVLSSRRLKNPLVRATLAYGYGLTVTPVQLAQAYLALATGGVRLPVGILKLNESPRGHKVFDRETVLQVSEMLGGVVEKDGTAPKASVAGFSVYGKTGTVRKVVKGGYDDTRHVAFFAGVAPASSPRVVVVVVINEPSAESGGGGAVAAPVFSRVVARALRLLNIEPDEGEIWSKAV